MKIGINASFARKANTGIGQVTINFLKELIKQKNGNEFVLYLEEDIDLKLPKNFTKKVFLPKYKRDDLIRKIWWEKFSLPKKVAEDGCDVLLSLYQNPAVLRSMLRSKKRTKHIMVVHDVIPKLFPEYLNNWRKRIYQRLTEGAIKKADKIIAISHRTEKDLIQHLGIDPQKTAVSYLDVDDIYKKEVSEKENGQVLKKYNLKSGYIYNGGGLDVRKNTKSVLQAYESLVEKYGQAAWLPQLVISGKLMPELAPLIFDAEKFVAQSNIKDRVILLDYVPQGDLPALYRNASVFIYPSSYEGFGLPVLEAMNQGTPVITSKTSSLPEVGSDAVLYCDPNSVEDLAMVLKNLLNNNHLKAALSLKGKERAGHFAWEKFVEKFLNIAKEI